MARFNANRLPYSQQDEILAKFCDVLSKLRNKSRIQDFLKDLLNRQERMMLVRRLLVAEQLRQGKTYREIQDNLHVGPNTIARVDRWLHFGRGGYQKAIKVLKARGL